MTLGALVSGCGDDTVAGGGGGAGGSGGAGGAAETLVFSPCPLQETQPFTAPPSGPLAEDGFEGGLSAIGEWLAYSDQLPGFSDAMAECAVMNLPAVWTEPDGDKIEVFVKRYPATTQPATGQLWLLDGGPGYPSGSMEHTAMLLSHTNPTLDIYLPHHRGTGKSTFAECTASAPSYGDCATQVPHLDGLTTTGAARDLAALIDAVDTGIDVFVYGISYGGYWAQRYLQVRPEQASGVILDSTVPVGGDYSLLDINADQAARRVLALCEADPTCSAKLEGDPLAKIQLANALEGSRCSPSKYEFGHLAAGDYFDRLLLPATIYRTLRCEDADLVWLEKMRAYHEWYGEVLIGGFSFTVNRNILYSELWLTDATFLELAAAQDRLLAVAGVHGDANGSDTWPRYPHDEHYGVWPSTSVPVLVLQAGLDARTPYGDLVREHYAGANQYYVELPLAAHGVMWPLDAPMADLGEVGCGAQIMSSFLADPSQPPATSCIAGMAPLDWANPPQEWLALVGIDDLWENEP